MMRALEEYGAIWRVTMVRRAERTVKVMALTGLVLTILIAVGACALVWRHEMNVDLSLRMLGAVAALWLILGWAVMFMPRSMMLNSAANARLIPRQRRRLMQMAAGGWLLTAGLMTAVAGNWGMFPLAGMFVLGLASIFVGNMLGLVLIVVPANWPLASRLLLPPAWVEAIRSTEGLLALSALALLVAAYCLRWMFPAGDDAHLGKGARQRERIQRIRDGEAWAKNLESGTVSGDSVLRLYGFALRRDGGQGKHPADPGKMLMHALGPTAHWSFWIASVVVVLAVGVFVHFLIAWRVNPDAAGMAYAASGSMGGMVSMILMSTLQLGQSINRTAGEQALLRLTPLAGDKRLLNRRLGAQVLQHALLVWTMLTVTILLANLLIFGATALVRQLALCCLAGQAAMGSVLGDYAGNGGGWTLPRALLAGAVALLEGCIAFGAGWLTDTPAWTWMMAIAVAVTAFQLRRAWQRMLAAPSAFPARRMALS